MGIIKKLVVLFIFTFTPALTMACDDDRGFFSLIEYFQAHSCVNGCVLYARDRTQEEGPYVEFKKVQLFGSFGLIDLREKDHVDQYDIFGILMHKDGQHCSTHTISQLMQFEAYFVLPYEGLPKRACRE